ncbi:YfjI family protein [Tsuneonella rigui]|uniref:YfjI family protein n=1 Tax=Tsuneonella rigui TaxID=1708790 RepID=UPI0013DEBFBB|nr:YfjI family protein [Tsuneonella rigui]
MVKFAEFFAHDFPDEPQLPRPRPLVEDERAQPYPVDALPSVIRDVVEEVAGYVKAPTALIAASALSAVSTAVQSCFSVQRDAALTGPATLYLLTVAESGERKSTVDRFFTAPIREWEAEQKRSHRERVAQYNADLEDWERRGEDLQRNIAGGFIDVHAAGNLDPRVTHQLEKPRQSARRRMLRGDDTPEALAMALADYPVASVISAEAGTIFGSHGMNAEAVMRNLAQANVMWDGGVIQRDRVSTGELQVEGMRVTMGLQVQPAVLDAFVQKTGGLAKGIGYFARFLFCHPESTQGGRYYDEPPADRPAQRTFDHQMTTLLAAEPVFDEHDRLVPHFVGFDAAAQQAWIRFHDEVEEKQGPEQEYANIRDVASKAADNAARLACCFHVFSGDPSMSIGLVSMVGACRLMRWYLDEAVRFAHSAGAAPELADAQLLEEWLVARVRAQPKQSAAVLVAVNEVRKKGPNRLRQAHSRRLDDALELLSDHHRVLVLRRAGRKGRDIYVRAEVLAEYSR